MKVLIADDDENSRELLQITLQARGHDVQPAADGLQALNLLRESIPDLVVSDVLMPEMDGFDLCRIIKNDKSLQGIPVIFYTATFTESQDEHLALALGASRFLVKPMDMPELLATIEQVLHEHYQQRVPVPDTSRLDQDELRRMHSDRLSSKLQRKIDELKEKNRALQASEERFRQLAENIRECFWIRDADIVELLYVSPAFEDIWGYSVEERFNNKSLWKNSIHPEDRGRVLSTYREKAQQGKLDVVYRIIRSDGGVRWVRDRGFPIQDDEGQVYRIAGIAEDITEAQELTNRLAYQASYDALTGLANRHEFEKRLNRVLGQAHAVGSQHALCYLDLDQFKVINDTCGHSAGDELLRQLGILLSQHVRSRDTLARLGGDEFALIMEHCSLEQGRRVADNLRKAVEGYRFLWQDTSFRVGVSMGLVSISKTSANFNEVLRAADSACYAAKEKGRNQIQVYRENDTVLAQRYGEMQWVGRINHALDHNQFRVYSQPIVSTKPGMRNGAHQEMLLRLRDEKGLIVPPDRFLPAAERYKLMTKIDRWVVNGALTWLAERMATIELCSINLSGQSLGDEEFLGYIIARIKELNIPPEKICFEITETAAVANLASAIGFVQVLKNLGCRFALDDFGSGLSSFEYLKNLPVDYLKIDGVFVRGIVHDSIDYAMVKSINDVGHVMGKQTIAEFVENNDILDKLREIGVDYAQGYGLGHPMPCYESG